MTYEFDIVSNSTASGGQPPAAQSWRHERRLSLLKYARLTYPDLRKRAFKRTRFLLLAAWHYRLHKVWFHLLDAPALRPMLARQPLLRAKIQHSYLVSGINPAQRLLLACGHFRTFLDRFPATVSAAIYQGSGLCLTAIESAGTRYELRLLHLPHCWQEGEVSIGLFEGSTLIASASFVLGAARDFYSNIAEGTVLFVGGLQGLQGGNGQETFRRATKAMHGLRPFSVLTHALRSLANALGAHRLLAVADAQHALRYKRAKRRIHLSYDDIWRDHAAVALPDGPFDLGTATPIKDLADVASHKRAQYRRRYAAMESIDTDIRAALRHCG